MTLERMILVAGIGQLGVLVASALVPFRLAWRRELRPLPRLLRQMHWAYGGYIVLSITAFGLISVTLPADLASGTALARAFSAYLAVFWSVRLVLQAVFDVKEHLRAWWLKAGYHALTLMFVYFTAVYGWAALGPAAP